MTNHNYYQPPEEPPQPYSHPFSPHSNDLHSGTYPFSESGNFTDGWSDALDFSRSSNSGWGGDSGSIGGSNNNNNNNNNNNG